MSFRTKLVGFLKCIITIYSKKYFYTSPWLSPGHDVYIYMKKRVKKWTLCATILESLNSTSLPRPSWGCGSDSDYEKVWSLSLSLNLRWVCFGFWIFAFCCVWFGFVALSLALSTGNELKDSELEQGSMVWTMATLLKNERERSKKSVFWKRGFWFGMYFFKVHWYTDRFHNFLV